MPVRGTDGKWGFVEGWGYLPCEPIPEDSRHLDLQSVIWLWGDPGKSPPAGWKEPTASHALLQFHDPIPQQRDLGFSLLQQMGPGIITSQRDEGGRG